MHQTKVAVSCLQFQLSGINRFRFVFRAEVIICEVYNMKHKTLLLKWSMIIQHNMSTHKLVSHYNC